MDKINLLEKFALFSEPWQPKIVIALAGQLAHQDRIDTEQGRLTIEFRDRVVALEPGELIVVPAGVEHRPVAEEEALVLLLEPQSTRNTGEVLSERTVEALEWI